MVTRLVAMIVAAWPPWRRGIPWCSPDDASAEAGAVYLTDPVELEQPLTG